MNLDVKNTGKLQGTLLMNGVRIPGHLILSILPNLSFKEMQPPYGSSSPSSITVVISVLFIVYKHNISVPLDCHT